MFNGIGSGLVTELSTSFYLSSLVAIVSNYLMNRASTFKGWQEQKGGFSRYMTMGMITLVLDNLLLVLLVNLFVNYYLIDGCVLRALAILINFSVTVLYCPKLGVEKKITQSQRCLNHPFTWLFYRVLSLIWSQSQIRCIICCYEKIFSSGVAR